MKEKIEKAKNFCCENQIAIAFAIGGLAGVGATYVTTKAALNALVIDEVGYDEGNLMIQLTSYKNGNQDRYFPTNPS